MKNYLWRNLALGMMTLCFVAMSSGIVLAQQDAPTNMNKTQPVIKQDSWEAWKQDMKTKYQQVRDQADKIKADAQTKKISDPGLKDAMDKFEENAKTFSDKWSTVDQVTPDKRDQYKTDVNNAWDKVKSSFDVLNSEWSSANK